MSKQELKRYSYEGPVCEFDRCITSMWTAETVAPSEKKALSNLAYQFKRETNRVARSRISLPGKLKIAE
jgi:hypothetical protein